MMEKLDEIPWSQLHHAYGPAADVPDLIRALSSADPQQRDAAFHELFGNIWHQGTVYEATIHALPFLIELLRQQSVPERQELALLVASILAGKGYYQVHASIDIVNPFTGKPIPKPVDLDERIRKERAIVAEIREVGTSALSCLVPFLADPDPEIRRSIAQALARYPQCKDALLASLMEAAAIESDDDVRAEMEKALGALQT